MKSKHLVFGILILLIAGFGVINWYINTPKENLITALKQDMISDKITPLYNFESNWWLKPQTFGMFNYYEQTHYTRLKITNSTVNGYRLVYDLKDFDYKKDIETAHKKNIKYVIGMLFSISKDETGKDIDNSQICLPYETIKNNSLQKAKKNIDLGADGLAIIHPFGDHFFIDDGISCLCQENPEINQDRNRQLNCAVKFYRQFTEEIKDYAKLKGKDNFPIAIASHGEWLIPFTINMLPFSDFAYANLDKIEDFPHAYEYKLHFSATDAPLIASPMDASFGWLVENSKKPEDLIQILMAEAYANKGAFQDQYLAGLSPSCITQGQTHFAESCWLDKSINADAVGKINSFYLTNKDLFNFNSRSLSKIGVLFSANSIKSEESDHWSAFKKVSKLLTLAHYQYNVLFSEDPEFSENKLTLTKLQQYKLIIIPQNSKLDSNTLSLIPKYLLKGGNLIILNQIDPRLSLPGGTDYIIMDNNLELPINRWFKNEEFFNAINNMIGKRISEDTLPEDIGIQIWQDENKTIIHIVNYDFDLNKGVIEKENIPVSVNLPFKKSPVAVKMLSPGFNNEQNIEFNLSNNNIQFTIPKLKVWDILIVE